ncbi:MAG: ABC transporter permease [Selenomonadaceae bacterium]|nr:ABC transporter permease [Selenomonadaceae bacterium]
MNALIAEIYKYRYLISELVVRDIKKKYRRSVLGVLWSLLNPLLTMIVTAMIFSNLFRFDIVNFPLYLLCGQIIVTFYNESTSFAMSSIIENGSLLKKVYIPKYLFPVSRVISSCVNLFFTLPALFLILIVTKMSLPLESFTFIIPLLLMFFFCLGVGLILSTIAVYFRDIFHLYGVFLSVLGYATPVFYPESIVPESYMFIFKINPLYFYLKAFRQAIYDGQFPELDLILICFAMAIAALSIGIFLFRKYHNNFILYI